MLKVSCLLFIFLVGCNNSAIYDDKFYYKTTHISIPNNFIVNESIDNGEFIAITSFKSDSVSLRKFVNTNKMRSCDMEYLPKLTFGINLLKKERPDINAGCNGIYHLSKSDKNTDWIYLVDINRKMLWAEIIYPDQSGN